MKQHFTRHKRKYIVAAVVATAMATTFYATNSHKIVVQNPPIVQPAPVADNCAGIDDLWTHIYHPARLQIIEKCKTITGVLINAVQEADGDWHMRINVADKSLINSVNVSGQHGYLVGEPICQKTPTQADAIDPCKGYSGPLFDVKSLIGQTIEVSGSYVLDNQHGGWVEIHPITKIEAR